MTKDERELLQCVARLVCSLAQDRVSRMKVSIANDLCDGPNSSRARKPFALGPCSK